MNKLLHALVYVFLVLAGIGLYLELQLNDKRTELTDRNRLQENYLVSIAKTVEKAEPDMSAAFELKKDVSAVEANPVDIPDMENVLEDYKASLEQANLETFNWDNPADRHQLRSVYALDFEGKPVRDGNEFQKTGKGTEDELLKKLFDACKTQQERLNTTRAALTELRGKLEGVVGELNALKPEARQDKITIVERNTKIAKLEEEKSELENQVTKLKEQVAELNTELSAKNDEIAQTKDELDAAKEEIEKGKKVVAHLNEMIRNLMIQARGETTAHAAAVTSLPAGEKGRIIEADNENMFAIIEFNESVMKELKGEDLSRPLPFLELGVKRSGFKGEAGEFVGRVRLRQEVKGKTYVVCDILGAWEQDKLKKDDIVYAD